MSANLRKTSEKVFIEGIPPMRYGEHMDNSFIRSVQLSLNTLGENYDYDYLMGISGAAFRLHFDPKWCPSSTDATCGFDVSEIIFKYLGFSSEFKRINHNSFSDIKALHAMIRKQIDSGKPVIAINLMGNMDWGIVTGYMKNEPGIICRTYYDQTVEYSIASRAPWLNFFIGEKKNGLTPDELFDNSLRIAVKLAETKRFDEYYSGQYAFEKWIERLDKIDKSVNKTDLAQIIQIHFIIHNALLDARRSAFNYLSASKAAGKLSNIDQIIEFYKRIVNLLESSGTDFGQYAGSDFLKQMEEIIRRQTEILIEVLEIEKKAIHLIKEEIKPDIVSKNT